jgi:hypothetical protein
LGGFSLIESALTRPIRVILLGYNKKGYDSV